MKRIAIMLAALVLTAAGITVAIGRLSPSESVYSVADVQAGLQREPAAWVGRVVLVRGSIALSSSSTLCASPSTRSRAASSSGLCRPITTIMIGPSALSTLVPVKTLSLALSNALSAFWMKYIRRLARVHLLGPGGIAARNFPRRTVWTYMFGSPTINLTVALRPGAHLPVAGPHHPLPDFLYTLPLVGSQLAHWFPRDNDIIFRVRLNGSPSCSSPAASVTCDDTDGVLVPS